MKAVTYEKDVRPRYKTFADPVASENQAVVRVRAAALTNLDVAIATSRHYFSAKSGPAVVGREAIVLSPQGDRLFLGALVIPVPFGSMAELALANLDLALSVPAGISDELAAALGNAGLAAWLSLSWRAGIKNGESVLIIGATGTTGQIAVVAAKLLGAGRVVAVGRDVAILEQLRSRGADETVQLTPNLDLVASFKQGSGLFDVVIDYLNGPPAEAAIQAMAIGGRMVQVGSLLGPGITVHAQTARRASLDVLGFAYYHAPLEQQAAAYGALCDAALAGAFDISITALPMEDFDVAWEAQNRGSKSRYVLRPY